MGPHSRDRIDPWLRCHDFFDALGLFSEQHHTISVRSLTHTDLYRLMRDDFERVVRDYPAQGVAVADAGHGHLKPTHARPSLTSSEAEWRSLEGLKFILYHLKFVLCGGDDRAFEYLIQWFGYIFQTRKKPGVMPQFLSDEGVHRAHLRAVLPMV